jgi:hypothetical protein
MKVTGAMARVAMPPVALRSPHSPYNKQELLPYSSVALSWSYSKLLLYDNAAP